MRIHVTMLLAVTVAVASTHALGDGDGDGEERGPSSFFNILKFGRDKTEKVGESSSSALTANEYESLKKLKGKSPQNADESMENSSRKIEAFVYDQQLKKKISAYDFIKSHKLDQWLVSMTNINHDRSQYMRPLTELRKVYRDEELIQAAYRLYNDVLAGKSKHNRFELVQKNLYAEYTNYEKPISVSYLSELTEKLQLKDFGKMWTTKYEAYVVSTHKTLQVSPIKPKPSGQVLKSKETIEKEREEMKKKEQERQEMLRHLHKLLTEKKKKKK